MRVAKIINSPLCLQLQHFPSILLFKYMPVYMTVKYGDSQANSSSRLKTRGLHGQDSANVASFSKFKNLGSLEGK
jgi:hypothetical protein